MVNKLVKVNKISTNAKCFINISCSTSKFKCKFTKILAPHLLTWFQLIKQANISLFSQLCNHSSWSRQKKTLRFLNCEFFFLEFNLPRFHIKSKLINSLDADDKARAGRKMTRKKIYCMSKSTLLLRLRFAISSRQIAAARASIEYHFGVDTKCVAPPLFIYLCAANRVRPCRYQH